jgi:uncharacterized LabA/DUF88 family protein
MPVSFDQRVGIFIDVQNMFYATKNLYGSKLNFSKLLDYIGRGRPIVRAISYVVQTPEIDQSNFLAMLRSNGYEIRSKELKQRPDGSCKGDWDMGLALDALAAAERLDVVAIVSGDGDFVELVNFLKARGVRVEVYSFPYSTAEELRASATEYFQMGSEIVMQPQNRYGQNGSQSVASYDRAQREEPARDGERQPYRERAEAERSFERPYRSERYGSERYSSEPRESYRDSYPEAYDDSECDPQTAEVGESS